MNSRLFLSIKNKTYWLIVLALAVVISSCSTAGTEQTSTMDSSRETTKLSNSQKTEQAFVPSLAPTSSAISTVLPLPTDNSTSPNSTTFTGMVPSGARLRISKGAIRFTALSPIGENIVIGSSITVCSYRVMDAGEDWCSTTGETSNGMIQSLGFDPEGKTIVTGLQNGDIILWDAAKGSQTRIIRTGLTLISNPTWSPDGQKLAYATGDQSEHGFIRIWNSSDGSELPQIKVGDFPVDVISWSPNGRAIATGDNSGQITILDASSANFLATIHPFPKQHEISSLVWSSDSTMLLAGSRYVSCAENCSPEYDGKITLIDAHTGAQRWQTDTGHTVGSLAVSPDTTLLLAWVGEGHREIQIRHISDGSLLRTITLNGATDLTLSATKNAFWLPGGSGDIPRLLTLDEEDNLAIFDTSGAMLSETHLDGYYQLTGLAWAPDSSKLAAISAQGLYIWDNATGQLLRNFDIPVQANQIAWSPDGKEIATTKDRQVFLWDAETGELLHTLASSGDYPRDLGLSADGRWFAALSLSGVPGQPRYAFIELWDARDWSSIRVIKVDNWEENGIEHLAWSPDGKTLAAAGNGIYLWDVSSGSLIKSFLEDMGAINNVEWSPDGSNLLAGTTIIDANSGAILVQVVSNPTNRISSATFSPDGITFATGGDRITLRDAHNGAILKTLQGFANNANMLMFSPDGKALASGSDDGTVILWEVP